jgi:hypothetical protein
MKRIGLFFLSIFLVTSFFVGEASASPVLWSKAAVDLDTLSFTTTGDLNVSFTNTAPTGTLVSQSDIFYTDIIEREATFEGVNYRYAAGRGDTVVRQSWDLTSSGSGVLKVDLDFLWEFNALSGYEPNQVYGGPDNIAIIVAVNGIGLAAYQQNAPCSASGWHSSWHSSLWSNPEGYLFKDGQVNSLEISIMTNANGLWVEKPNGSTPVPEPTTMALFGIGVFAISAIGRRKRN